MPKAKRPQTDDERVNTALQAVHARLVARGVAADWRSPDILAMEDEEAGGDLFLSANLLVACDPNFTGTKQELWLHVFDKLMRFLALKGPDPRAILQRFFAIALALKSSIIGNMSATDVAKMLDERKASTVWRTKKIFEREAGTFAPNTRGQETRAKNAAAARRRHATKKKK